MTSKFVAEVPHIEIGGNFDQVAYRNDKGLDLSRRGDAYKARDERLEAETRNSCDTGFSLKTIVARPLNWDLNFFADQGAKVRHFTEIKVIRRLHDSNVWLVRTAIPG